jgi:DNA polymerase-3 subunit alpha
MTSTGGRSIDDGSPPPGARIAECRLAYLCGYVKAHFPVSFYAALLTHICRSRRRLARALRELRQEGIRLLPPDINMSSFRFTQVGERIRTGLIVVSKMGEKAAAEIDAVRRGGAFHNLQDFCRRTDPKLINHRLVENLIKAGAMDTFGLRRSQMLAMLDRVMGMPRMQPADSAASVQMEFRFGNQDPAPPDEELEVPDLPELPPNLRLQYELQTASHTISAELLSPFEDLLTSCRIARAPVALSQRWEGRDLYLAGTVDQIERSGETAPNGTAVWLDFAGVFVAVSDRLFDATAPQLRSNEVLVIGGKVVRQNDECHMQAHTVIPLLRVHQQASQAMRVVLDLENENRQTVRALRQICGQFPGKTPVVAVHCEAAGVGLRRLQSSRVTVCPGLINSLRKVLDRERVRVVGYGDQ